MPRVPSGGAGSSAFAGHGAEDLLIASRFFCSARGPAGSAVFASIDCTGLCCRSLTARSFSPVFFRHLGRAPFLAPSLAAFRRGGFGGLASPFLAFLALRGEQRQCLGEGEGVGIGIARQRRDHAVMADIGTVASAIEADRAAFGVGPELADQLRPAALPGRRFGQQHDGAVQTDRQHVIIGAERFEGRFRA